MGIPAGGSTITQPQNLLLPPRRSLLGAPGSQQPWSCTAPPPWGHLISGMGGFQQLSLGVLGPWGDLPALRVSVRKEEGSRGNAAMGDGPFLIGDHKKIRNNKFLKLLGFYQSSQPLSKAWAGDGWVPEPSPSTFCCSTSPGLVFQAGQEWFPAFLALRDDPFSAQKADNSACCKLKLNKKTPRIRFGLWNLGLVLPFLNVFGNWTCLNCKTKRQKEPDSDFFKFWNLSKQARLIIMTNFFLFFFFSKLRNASRTVLSHKPFHFPKRKRGKIK